LSAFGLIFDMDGVLIDSADAHRRSWRMLARETGREFSDDAFAATFGRQNRDIIPQFFGRNDEAGIRDFGDRKEALYREIVRGRVPAMPGAIELIRACYDDGLALAIGSSGPPENIELALAGLEVRKFFRTVITSREVSRGKPHPQVFQLAAQGLGIPPDRCAVVEDAPAGIEAAIAAGMVAIALVGTHTRHALCAAHHIVGDLRDLSHSLILKLLQDR